MTSVVNFAPLLQRFFTERLMQQRRVSPHTISSYRDTFRQLLKFTQHRLHKSPSTLGFEEIDAPLVVAFLDHLEKSQGLSVPAICGSLRSTRCFVTLPLSYRLTPHRSSVSSPFLASASRARSSASSLVQKSMLCSAPQTAAPGSAGAITHSS